MHTDSINAIRGLNTCCAPATLDRNRLMSFLAAQMPPGQASDLDRSHPHLFASERVYLTRDELGRMQDVIAAVEKVRHNPAYRHQALANADPDYTRDPGTIGVFGSYDFHLTRQGPALIEINTNAGGAFLAAAAAASHKPCCPAMAGRDRLDLVEQFETNVIRTFLNEWRTSGRTAKPSVIAIVDDNPSGQYLYPEFLTARSIFEKHGLTAMIVDPSELMFDKTTLSAGNVPIDIVYNRLTDFTFRETRHTTLRAASLADAVVVTPHPFHHAILAHKTNLTRLSDPAFWDAANLSAAERAAFAHIPETRLVTEQNAETLWNQRKSLYFKPIASHAAKGVYRGAKITRSAWEQVRAGGYVAQKAAPPSDRLVHVNGVDMPLKTDIRVYTYGPQTLLVAARLYRGQTTNMRTPGGGFAPVTIL